ncbi:MAG: phosphopyruvate hydratase [Candidatus Kerfeldbacteria bacterium]|nr:phosphopyruvate hydratase [Candidatus Kerfeldbacteria bacterium]
MTQTAIASVTAREILDSRGEPTVLAVVTLADGLESSAAVPAGRSSGTHEAWELRDNESRFGGKGVRRAVAYVKTEIHAALKGMDVSDQSAIDRKLIELDGTENKSRLGANAILSVSLACARLAALANRLPLYKYLQKLYALPAPKHFPKPMCNILNGGLHADNGLSFQEFMILPAGESYELQLERAWSVINALKDILHERGERTLVGDEGGFAPKLASNEAGLELLTAAIERAKLQPGTDVSIGLDPASSEFHSAKGYDLQPEGKFYDADAMIELYAKLQAKYALKTLEDGLAEDDWDGWTKLTEKLGSTLTLIGDDLFVTQRDRLSQGIRAKAANAILIKPNQVGTLTETMDTIATARDDGYGFVVSHRSGETPDTFIADLAVAVGSPYLKAGSLTRGERLAKYNRLLEIAAEVGA